MFLEARKLLLGPLFSLILLPPQVPHSVRMLTGFVETEDGTQLKHVMVRIANVGEGFTTDSGQFAVRLPAGMESGSPVVFSVQDWVVTDPYSGARGKMYIPKDKLEPIKIVVSKSGSASLRTERQIGHIVEAVVVGLLTASRASDLSEQAKEIGIAPNRLRSLIEDWKRTATAPYDKGLAALEEKNYPEASRLIEQSMSGPGGSSVEKLISLGSAEYYQGHYAKAGDALSKARDLAPNDFTALNSLSTVFQKLVEQFQNASAAARETLTQVNSVELNGWIDQLTFEQHVIDMGLLRSYALVSLEEIAVRTSAFDQLQAYADNLAWLAQGNVSAISEQTNNLSKTLGMLSKEVGNLPPSKASFLKNAEFGKALQAVGTGVGLMAQIIAQHKPRAELGNAIMDNKKPIDDLIGLLAEELDFAHRRQQAILDAEQIYISKAYERERSESHPDRNALSFLGDHLKSYVQQRTALEAADPAPSLKSMQEAHDALVRYAQSVEKSMSLSNAEYYRAHYASIVFQKLAEQFHNASVAARETLTHVNSVELNG